MQDLLGIGTNRRESMIGTGIGLGLSGYRLAPFGFSPSLISGLKLWLDASDSGTLYQSSGGSVASNDGDPVGQWRDKSGNNNHLTQTDGTKKPVVKMSIKANKPCVRFDGVNDKLGPNAFTLNQPEFIFSVMKCGTNNAQAWDGAAQDAMWGQANTASFRTYAGAYGPVANSFTLNAFWLVEVLYNGSSSEIWLNGASGGTGNVGGSNAGGFTIGASAGNYTNQSMDACEVLIYQSALTATDRQKIESYLMEKWSI